MSADRTGRVTVKKLTALLLSWAVPATSLWAAAPPPLPSTPSAAHAAAASIPPRAPLRHSPALSPLRTSAAGPTYHPFPTAEPQEPSPSTPSGSVIVGKALSDATGLPVADAEVRLAGSEETLRLTDGEGWYAIPAPAAEHWILVEKGGFVPVERRVVAAAGLGAPVLDARLTPLAASTTIGPSGGPATTGNVRVTIPPGAVTEDTGFIVTPLTGQGLPGYLPLGYAPVAAFALQAGRVVSGPFTVRFSGLPGGMSLHLIEYRRTEHAWHLLEPSVDVDEGVAAAAIPGVGAFALVTVDEGGPGLPGPEGALTGSAAVAWPAGATGSVEKQPISIPATGATALGHLTTNSPAALPSGMMMQAQLTDRLVVRGVPSEDEPRHQDVVAYRSSPEAAQTLRATIPLAPARTFEASVPVTGTIHIEFWTSRASQGGSVGGGSESVTVESGPARLTVAAGSLPTDTAVSIQSVPLSAFLPVAPGVTALGEVVVDLAGAVLNQSAELSLAGAGGGTLVIARVERFAGVPYVVAVSLAEVQGHRIVSASYPGLPGIVRGGRYVFYRIDSPIGFVAGTTSSPRGPERAVVSTPDLPFVGVSSAAGAYITAAKPGPAVEVTARIPPTPHEARGSVAVTAGETTSLDLALTAGLTTVVVTPADGSTGVPVSTVFNLTANQPLDEATVNATTVKLIQGNPATGPVVPTRRVLSVDRQTLAVLAEAELEPTTVYVLRVMGLKDSYGGPVTVPDTHITTRADVAPEYDLDKLKFSFPDAEGFVSVTAAAGSFPPASTLMILNEWNAAHLTMSVGNEGEVSGELPATLDDVMLVTFTDTLGNTLTARRSKYADTASGRVSIGSTGGVVEGTGGVELRLPAGAVERGVVFKADLVNPASLPPEQRPSLGEGTVASAIRIEAPSQPSFRREVDLAFPKPADAPAGAFYYVVRQLTDSEGRVFFQTVDTAAVEGDKVVTNSWPFPGYDGSLGGLAYAGPGTVQLLATASNTVFLVWFFDQLLPSRPQMGVIHGRVTRSQWNAETRQWEYVPVKDAVVRRLLGAGDPLRDPTPGTTSATTRDDGTYVLFDSLYQSGFVMVRATDPQTGQEAEGPGYGLDQADRPVWARPYRAVAVANVAFPSTAPQPRLTLRLLERAGDAWQVSDGLVVEDQPIAVGVSVANATVEQGSLEGILDGTLLSFGEGQAEHLGFPWVAEAAAASRGASTVSVTFRPEVGNTITETATFLVIGEGGDNNQVLPDRAPEVILPRLVPQPDATAVSPGIYAEVAFTEPVANLPGQVTLHELAEDGSEGPALGVEMYGTGPQGVVTSNAFTDQSQVSLLTIRPEAGLKYLTKYRLKLSGAIHDLDAGQTGDPKELDPFTLDFETFRSGVVGGSDETFLSAGIVVMENRAWLVRNQFLTGILHTFDIQDPVEPKQIPGTAVAIAGRPVDMAGETVAIEAESAIPGVRRLLAVAQTVTNQSRPSNLHIFDVTEDTPRRIGAATLSRTATEGTLSRVEVKGRHAYAITWRKGVLVVDLLEAKRNFDESVAANGDDRQINDLLGRDGHGFGHDAVVQTIPLFKPNSLSQWLLMDLKVGDYVYGGQTQPLVFVAGELGFALVNPQAGDWTIPASLQVGANRLTSGYALALGHLDDKDVAIVVGAGQANHPATGESTAGPVLAVVNLTEILTPSNPPGAKVLSVIPLFGGNLALASAPTDVILNDNLAVVASDRNAIIVNLSSLSQPRITGQFEGIGGRLALDGNGLLFGSAWSATAGQSEFGGIRTATLGHLTRIIEVKESPVIVALDRKSIEPQTIRYRAIFPRAQVETAELEVLRGGTVIQTFTVPPLDATGKGSYTLQSGIEHPLAAPLSARLVVNRSKPPSERPAVSATMLPAAAFSLLPDQAATVQVGGEPEHLFAWNRAIQKRLHEPREPRFQAPLLTWANIGAPNAIHMPLGAAPADGVYTSEVVSTGQANSAHQFELRQGSTILGRSAPMIVLPGPADRGVLSSDRSGVPVAVPADGHTVLALSLDNVRDAAGNPVADGTPVSWIVLGDGGDIIDPQTTTVGGGATARYRAGIEEAEAAIVAEVDGQRWSLTVSQKRLETTLALNGGLVEIEVNSAAGLPADGTKVLWATLYGRVLAEDGGEEVLLIGGRARGRWVPSNRPGENFRVVDVVSTVGRSRGHLVLDRSQVGPLPPGPRLSLDAERLMGDRTSPYTIEGDGDTTAMVPAATMVRVAGADPGVPLHLTVGTLRFPAHEPIAAYGFDVAQDGATPDVYGSAPVLLHEGASVETSPSVYGIGHLRFESDSEGATAPGLPAFTSDFGFSGYVSFDAPAAGQRVIAKAGSYTVAVVEQGDPHLAFSVVSGGVERRVVSTQVLQPDTWYFFAVRIRNGKLWIQVGDEEGEQEGEPCGSADPSTPPVTLGQGLHGRLDAMRVYDFSRQPLFAFAGGQTAVDVIPDAAGTAQVQLLSTGLLAAPDGIEATGGITIGIGGYVQHRGLVAQHQFVAWVERNLTSGCLEAIKTGEPATLLGFACEVGVGLTFFGGVAQGVRDVVYTGRNFVRSKKRARDYVVATVAIGFAVLAIVPGVRSLRSLSKARVAAEGSEAVGRVVAQEMEEQTLKAIDGQATDFIPEQSILSLFDEAAPAATRQAATELVESLANPQAAREALDRLAKVFGPEALVLSLNRIRTSGRFTNEVIERLVFALDDMPGLGRVSDEALEGMAVFIHRMDASARLSAIWGIIRGVSTLSPQEHLDVMQRTFALVHQAAAANALDLDNVLKALKNPGLSLNNLKGAINHLDEAAAIGWSRISSMDRRVPGYHGEPDIMVREGARVLEIEVKNLGKDSAKLLDRDEQQLLGKIIAAIGRASVGGDVDRRLLSQELGNMIYRIRGTENIDYSPGFRQYFYELAGDWLFLHAGEQFRELGRGIGLFFSARRLPF